MSGPQPSDVSAVRRKLARKRKHELSEVAGKFINERDPELVRMWRVLERRNTRDDDSWVWTFLSSAAAAKNLPRYHHLSARERRNLVKDLSHFAEGLARTLAANELDAHLVCIDDVIFKGFYLYEGFSEPNQARIDSSGTPKLRLSTLIKAVATIAQSMVAAELIAGKSGQSAAAIRFVRLIAESNKRLYDHPLPAVITPAVNALFSMAYGVGEIRQMLRRPVKNKVMLISTNIVLDNA